MKQLKYGCFGMIYAVFISKVGNIDIVSYSWEEKSPAEAGR
jgi:hypothetical protein